MKQILSLTISHELIEVWLGFSARITNLLQLVKEL